MSAVGTRRSDEEMFHVKRGAAHNGPENYSAGLPSPVRPRTIFDALICKIVGCQPCNGRSGLTDGRRAKMITALEDRATWSQIRHWRRGEISAPAWAVELLTNKLRQQQHELTNAVILALAHKPGRGQGWNKRS